MFGITDKKRLKTQEGDKDENGKDKCRVNVYAGVNLEVIERVASNEFCHTQQEQCSTKHYSVIESEKER